MGCINEINGETKLFGLLGSPVSHSVSPLMHNEAFKILDLNCAYLCFDVNEKQLPIAFNGLKELNIKGFNCTMPNKTAICKLVDKLSPEAEIIGAVNTVVNESGTFVGYNTDGTGYIESLKYFGHSIVDKNVTLLGAGGAASSICVQAALDGAKSINVFNRKGQRYNKFLTLIERLENFSDCKVILYDFADYNSLNNSIANSNLLINATPIGMADSIDASPIPKEMLHSSLIVSDIIYNPRETKFLKDAKNIGCKTFNGMYMLLFQGAKAFKLWTGKDMPIEEIKKLYF